MSYLIRLDAYLFFVKPLPAKRKRSASARTKKMKAGALPPESDFNVQFTGAISFVINCETQEEVDYFWEKLSSGGQAGVCGWVNHDKFGITWQVTPVILPKMLSDKDPEKTKRVMAAMLKMNKLNIAVLEKAYEGR